MKKQGLASHFFPVREFFWEEIGFRGKLAARPAPPKPCTVRRWGIDFENSLITYKEAVQ
jgi:hypothetical protein